jgi:Cu2+-exporting ATPase
MTEAHPHAARSATAVLHVGGLHYASEKTVVERMLANRPGVVGVEANPVAQTASVTFDPDVTSVDELTRRVEECGYHCAGRSVPGHVCDPLADEAHDAPAYDRAAVGRADDAHGHGHGGHAGMSMEAMVRDMRNRFLAALVFAIPIAVWSPLGEFFFGRHRRRRSGSATTSGSSSSACRSSSTRPGSSSTARTSRCEPGPST